MGKGEISVLVTGEPGTGKELVARALHDRSSRAGNIFLPVNCGGLSDSLLESELFGHEKGAFTGAVNRKKGRFELASGGTIFLDEIGDTSPAMQVKLLRVLQEGTFERVGGSETIRVDVRVISATNQDLKGKLKDGSFREDLYYRIKVAQIEMPPLRMRRSDIPALLEHFIAMHVKGDVQRPEISSDALTVLTTYAWPGNVRELENAVRHAVLKSGGKPIEVEHLPPDILSGDNGPGNSSNHPDGPVAEAYPDADTRARARKFLDRYEEACRTVADSDKVTQRALATALDVKHTAIVGVCKQYGDVIVAFLDAFPEGWPNLARRTAIRKWCRSDT